MYTTQIIAEGEGAVKAFQKGFTHRNEINPHLELSDEEYFIQYCIPDEIEQKTEENK